MDFEEIKAKVQFDTDLYKLTLTSIEKTRVEAARKLKVLVGDQFTATAAGIQIPEYALHDRQLAADLLPAVRNDQIIAGGHR